MVCGVLFLVSGIYNISFTGQRITIVNSNICQKSRIIEEIGMCNIKNI